MNYKQSANGILSKTSYNIPGTLILSLGRPSISPQNGRTGSTWLTPRRGATLTSKDDQFDPLSTHVLMICCHQSTWPCSQDFVFYAVIVAMVPGQQGGLRPPSRWQLVINQRNLCAGYWVIMIQHQPSSYHENGKLLVTQRGPTIHESIHHIPGVSSICQRLAHGGTQWSMNWGSPSFPTIITRTRSIGFLVRCSNGIDGAEL